MAYRAGGAFITVSPSFRGWQTKAKAFVQTLKAIEVPAVLDIDTTKSRARIKTAMAAAKDTTIKMDADTTAAETKIRAATRSRRAKVFIDVDGNRAMRGLSLIENRLDRLTRGRFIINVAIAAAPLAIPALAAGAGALGGLGAIGAAGAAGAGGFAAIATASMKRTLDTQKGLLDATKARTSATATLRGAQEGLASAATAAGRTQVAAARSIADAERGVVDARQAGARSIASAEEAVADARRNATRTALDGHRQIVAAQEQLVASQERVRASLDALHQAREQAKRDLADLAEQARDNALTVESADIALIEAKDRLATVEAAETTTALGLRKARLDVAEAEDRLSDARRQAARDAAALRKAEKVGVSGSDGVRAAREQVKTAREEQREARDMIRQARRDAAQANRDAAADVAGAREALAVTQVDAARSVADAQRNLARTQVDAGADIAASQQQVAAANLEVAAAEAELAAASQTRRDLLRSLSPAQLAALAGVKLLRKEWNGFLDDVDRPVLGALGAGMVALRKSLPALAAFIKPVSRGLKGMFAALGDATATKTFRVFARDFGRFSAGVLGDAGAGIINLAAGFGNLFRAFMPLGTDMSAGLVRLTERFAAWSSTVGQSAGFKSFIAYVRENGPLLMETLGNIGGALIGVGIALAPMASAMLRGLNVFAQWVTRTAEAHPMLIRVVAGVALFTAGVTAIARPLAAVVGVGKTFLTLGMGLYKVIRIVAFNLKILFFVMRASPIGIIVTVLALLVAGFVLAYKKVGWFRTGVDAAWKGIQNAVKFAWDKVILPIFKLLKWWYVDVLWGAVKKLATGFKTGWTAIKDNTRAAVLVVADKVLWMAEKILGAMVRAFGWAPKIGDKLKAALDKVQGFRKGVNKELDGIRDENVKVTVTTMRSVSLNARNKNEGQLGAPRGGRGPIPAMGGAGLIPRVSAPMAGVRKIASRVAQTRSEIAMQEAERIQAQLKRNQIVTGPRGKAGRVLPKGSYRIGMPYLGYPGHYGADYPAATGTPVSSPWAGRVSGSYDLPGSNPYNSTPYRSYGRVIKINHANGISSLYAHLSARGVNTGQTVKAGQFIGRVGMNGNATGPHLHWETSRNGSTFNPASLGVFDKGGYLPPGLSAVYNGTGKREHAAVFTDGQWQTLRRAVDGGGTRVHAPIQVTMPASATPEAAANAAGGRITAALSALGI